jgi:hypothetical protein
MFYPTIKELCADGTIVESTLIGRDTRIAAVEALRFAINRDVFLNNNSNIPAKIYHDYNGWGTALLKFTDTKTWYSYRVVES